ncbi:hypothetical protein D4764_03G0000520 [Takifugu flavidus]|uniref:Uncharacterized protein n=1 Tax=Takifugu flavidus TaxID=433684 RepID=A0A5C6N6C5_9TELE|nr:hypothetical protein D4764_03G0000520 [Takifugu flavidus]
MRGALERGEDGVNLTRCNREGTLATAGTDEEAGVEMEKVVMGVASPLRYCQPQQEEMERGRKRGSCGGVEGERQEWVEALQTATQAPVCGSRKPSDSLPSANKLGL